MLINAYATVRDLPALDFPHQLNGQRDRRDAELAAHLEGFLGYVASRGDQQMTSDKYHVMLHLQRVLHQLSFVLVEPTDETLGALADWARRANAVFFFEDGSVRDPRGKILIAADSGEADPDADLPHPADALDRRRRVVEQLALREITIPDHLPPVISEAEVVLREPGEVAARALALFCGAIRAEGLLNDEPIAVEEIRRRLPLAVEQMTPLELAYLACDAPQRQVSLQFIWRYEALNFLLWSLGIGEELVFPRMTADVATIAQILLDADAQRLIDEAKLRDTAAILDALDFHYALHWVVRDAQLADKEPPQGVDGGVVLERHYAANWLVRFGDADWDEVDTPT